MSGEVRRFLFYEPSPNESVLVTIAMVLGTAMVLMTGIGLLVQLNWAGLPCLAFAGVLVWALWSVHKYARPEERVELTPAAAEMFRGPLAAHQDSANARVYVGLELIDDAGSNRLDVVVRCIASLRWPDEMLLYRSQKIPLAVPVPALARLRGAIVDYDASSGEIVVRVPERTSNESQPRLVEFRARV